MKLCLFPQTQWDACSNWILSVFAQIFSVHILPVCFPPGAYWLWPGECWIRSEEWMFHSARRGHEDASCFLPWSSPWTAAPGLTASHLGSQCLAGMGQQKQFKMRREHRGRASWQCLTHSEPGHGAHSRVLCKLTACPSAPFPFTGLNKPYSHASSPCDYSLCSSHSVQTRAILMVKAQKGPEDSRSNFHLEQLSLVMLEPFVAAGTKNIKLCNLPTITHDSCYHYLTNTIRMWATFQKSFLNQGKGKANLGEGNVAKHSPTEIHKEEYAVESCIWWASFLLKGILDLGRDVAQGSMTSQWKEWQGLSSLCPGSAGSQTKSIRLSFASLCLLPPNFISRELYLDRPKITDLSCLLCALEPIGFRWGGKS